MAAISTKRLPGEDGQSASIPCGSPTFFSLPSKAFPDRFRAFRAAMEEPTDSPGRAVTEAAELVIVAAPGSLEEQNRWAEDLHAGGDDRRGL